MGTLRAPHSQTEDSCQSASLSIILQSEGRSHLLTGVLTIVSLYRRDSKRTAEPFSAILDVLARPLQPPQSTPLRPHVPPLRRVARLHRRPESYQAATDKVKDADMSFKLPNNVPNFDNAQRRFEDHVWNKFGGNEKELPMYKDKPSYGARRGRGWFSGKTRVGIIAFVVLGAVYWLWFSNRGLSEPMAEDGKKTSWTPGKQTGKKGVNWSTRRESVKDAFLLSWKGYEEHGWGRSRIPAT
jgi:hypothetical protein